MSCYQNRERNRRCNLDYLRPSLQAQSRIEAVRAMFLVAEDSLRELLQQSRETNLCWTNLEQASQWAIKGICLDDKYPDTSMDPVSEVPNEPTNSEGEENSKEVS